jgi:hypothetical protein
MGGNIMRNRLFVLVGLVLIHASAISAGEPAKGGLTLVAGQKEFLALEPILVTIKLDGPGAGLPAETSLKEGLRFEIKPPVKPRAGAKPLPQELKTIAQSGVKSRVFDLLEWHQFPAEGTFTVQAVLESKGSPPQSSAPLTIKLRRPAKDDSEWGPVDRLHHMPWSNYVTDAFCGDTFDVVKRWPDSKLAKYCHYWNGLHSQHKKEYDKAAASFQIVIDRYPDFILTPAARTGLAEVKNAGK